MKMAKVPSQISTEVMESSMNANLKVGFIHMKRDQISDTAHKKSISVVKSKTSKSRTANYQVLKLK